MTHLCAPAVERPSKQTKASGVLLGTWISSSCTLTAAPWGAPYGPGRLVDEHMNNVDLYAGLPLVDHRDTSKGTEARRP
ncbi:unnamed protein product [Merluccius merluccius]